MAVKLERMTIGLHSSESEKGALITVDSVRKMLDDIADDEDIEVIRGKIVYYMTILES